MFAAIPRTPSSAAANVDSGPSTMDNRFNLYVLLFVANPSMVVTAELYSFLSMSSEFPRAVFSPKGYEKCSSVIPSVFSVFFFVVASSNVSSFLSSPAMGVCVCVWYPMECPSCCRWMMSCGVRYGLVVGFHVVDSSCSMLSSMVSRSRGWYEYLRSWTPCRTVVIFLFVYFESAFSIVSFPALFSSEYHRWSQSCFPLTHCPTT